MKKIIILSAVILFLTTAVSAQNIEQKAKSGNVQAMYTLANEYYNGIGRVQNKAFALRWFEKAAKKNHIESMFHTAKMYEKGETITSNLRIAFNYYLLAAEKGHHKSQLIVAQKLEKGEGVRPSKSRAYLWYRVCAERNEELACKKMGDYFLWGNVVGLDHIQAQYWYEKIPTNLDAMASLAYTYIANKGIRPDIERAVELNQKPFEANIPLASYTQGFIEQNTATGDIKKAFENYSKAVNCDIQDAVYPLAMMYYEGDGVEKNTPKAFSLMDKLHSSYDKEIGLLMGFAYQSGEGVEVNLEMAAIYYMKAVNADNAEACVLLAQMYENGWGVKRNLTEARKLRAKAKKIENPSTK